MTSHGRLNSLVPKPIIDNSYLKEEQKKTFSCFRDIGMALNRGSVLSSLSLLSYIDILYLIYNYAFTERIHA